MKPSSDVVFALTGNVRHNSRALKQLRLLSNLGLSVTVLSYGPPCDSDALCIPGTSLHILPRPQGSGPCFFWHVHRQFAYESARLPARIYHASDLYTLPAMQRGAKYNRGQLVYDARELYTHLAATVHRPWVRITWRAVERRHISDAAAVFTVSDSIADHLACIYAVPRPIVLHNVPPRISVRPSTSLRVMAKVPSDTAILLHQGNIQKDRGCRLLVDAMRSVHAAMLIFLGGGPLKPALQAYVKRENLTHCVRFLDPVPPDQLLSVTATADVGISLLENTCLNHRFALPNKLFEYLQAGLPVLTSDLPEMADIVRQFNVGRVVCPSDADALSATLQDMVNNIELRKIWAANTPRIFGTFSWKIASERFAGAYRKLLL